MRAGRKVSEEEEGPEREGEPTVQNMAVVLTLSCVHQNHLEDEGGAGSVKNTDAFTTRYASLKSALFSFPNVELYMNGITYVFPVTTFCAMVCYFSQQKFISKRAYDIIQLFHKAFI